MRRIVTTLCLALALAVPGTTASTAAPEPAPTGSTVVDTTHNLLWEQKSADPASAQFEGRRFSYAEAEQYVETLNATSYGGRGDWRVPSQQELMTLVDLDQPAGRATIDGAAFPAVGPHWFWTSSRYELIPSMNRMVSFRRGNAFIWDRAARLRVIAVSGGGWQGEFDPAHPDDPANLHPDARNETVIDEVTGLQWEQKLTHGQGSTATVLGATLQQAVNLANFTHAYPMLLPNLAQDLAADEAVHDALMPLQLARLVTHLGVGLPTTGAGALTGVLDTLKGYSPNGQPPFGPRSWVQLSTPAQALQYVDWLNDKGGRGYPGGYAGHRDWRLPTVEEMLTIADWSRGLPLVKRAFSPHIPMAYWTADVNPETKRHYFVCTFSLMVLESLPSQYGLPVRAVRGTRAPLQPAGSLVGHSE